MHRHVESTATVRPSILPRLSLALSIAAFLTSAAAFWVSVNPESARALAMKAPGALFPKTTSAKSAVPQKTARKGEIFGPSVQQVIDDHNRRGYLSPADVHEAGAR